MASKENQTNSWQIKLSMGRSHNGYAVTPLLEAVWLQKPVAGKSQEERMPLHLDASCRLPMGIWEDGGGGDIGLIQPGSSDVLPYQALTVN